MKSLGGLGVSMVLCALFPSTFLKDDAKWTYQSDVGRLDVAFAGEARDGQIEVQGKTLRVDRPQWIRDVNHNQGVVVHFPASYLQKTYRIELKPHGNAKEISLGMSFLGKDLRVCDTFVSRIYELTGKPSPKKKLFGMINHSGTAQRTFLPIRPSH